VALPLEQLEGKYEILEKIREGGMGALYKVRHVLLGEVRVVKVMRADLAGREEARQRFVREARSAIRLRHPNIAQLHDFSLAEDGTGLIVMEYIHGLSFQEVLARSGPPGLALTLEMALQSLRALEYLHRLGYVHRDISPDNLMLTRDVDGEPLVKLIDLGIAKGRSNAERGVTSTGTVLGKIRYAAPENFKTGSSSIDHRADLYSFGIVLYQLLTGACPVRGTDPNTLLAGHLLQPIVPFAESDLDGKVPHELRRIVEAALEKEPERRIPSAERFWSLLHEARRRQAVPSPDPAMLDAVLADARPPAVVQPAPGTTQGLLDEGFPPEETGSAQRPAHLDLPASPDDHPPQTPTAPPSSPPPEPPRGSGLLERAWDLFDDGDLDEAERLRQEALAVSPEHPAERGLGQRIAEARARLAHAEAEARRRQSRQLIERAADAFEDGDLERCEALLVEAGRADPTDPLPADEIGRLREIGHRREQERARERTAPVVTPAQASPPAAPPPEVPASAARPPSFRDARASDVTPPPSPDPPRSPGSPPAETPTEQPDLDLLARLPESYTAPPRVRISTWVWSASAAAAALLATTLGLAVFRGQTPGAVATVAAGTEDPAARVAAAAPPEPEPVEDAGAGAPPSAPPEDVAATSALPATGRPRDDAARADGSTDGSTGRSTPAAAAAAPAPTNAPTNARPAPSQTSPIHQTEDRDEAFALLERARAAGIEATVSRRPDRPLPFAVEAGPYETSEQAQRAARRARSALGLDAAPPAPPVRDRTPPPRDDASATTDPAPRSGDGPTPAAGPTQRDASEAAGSGERAGGAEPAATADQPLPVSGDVVAPQLIEGRPPDYTELARRARLQGVVVLRAIIDETGTVREATVLKGLPMGLNEAAVAAVEQWRYRPATLRGRPVTVSYNVAVNFRLQ
jgi:eukaryotic-like serine/threonine-protein kinase